MTNLMYDTPTNRIKALILAEDATDSLSPQELAATRTSIWVEDGYIHYSGQWSGYSQPPEGEVDQRELVKSCTLAGYNPAAGCDTPWLVATGQKAMTQFWELASRKEYTREVNRVECDYRDPDTGIRVCNGYLLQ